MGYNDKCLDCKFFASAKTERAKKTSLGLCTHDMIVVRKNAEEWCSFKSK